MSSLSKSSSPALSRSNSMSDDDDYSAESASSTFDDALMMNSPRTRRRSNANNKLKRRDTRREARRSRASRRHREKSHGNASKPDNESEQNKVDIMFDDCHWYDIPCPHPECYEKGVRFDNHDKFKLHHEQVHCPRGENGDIDRAKDSLRWQCPVITNRVIDGEQYKIKCNKISNSWYNYAGHITSHKEIGHGWGCALPPEGKRKKTNRVHPRFNHLVVCGKRTSTKHHLLAHMSNVHKGYNVIDANGRQYNKKRSSNRKKPSVSGSKRRSLHDDNDDDDDDDNQPQQQDEQSNHSANTASLLQMRLPDFPKLSLPANPSGASSTSAFIPLLPQIPNNVFATSLSLDRLLPFSHSSMSTFGEAPRLKKMRPNFPPLPITQHGEHADKNRLIPDSQGQQCSAQDEKQQFEFLNLLCVAAKIHKECLRCTPRDDTEKLMMMKAESDENHGVHRDEDMEGSLPSLPSLTAVNSNQSQPSFHSTSTDTLSEHTANTSNSHGAQHNEHEHNHAVPKFPQIQTIFPNLLSNPFSFDLSQLCAASRNAATTASTAANSESALQNGVITTAIPQIPIIPSSLSSFTQAFK
mmetsp:Transcript_64837/g.103167  ORF Transcript_64837/g.103167 Transcript_64837/m.103167 type:complete len:582 (+) Transcript_64837:224-1969(+)